MLRAVDTDAVDRESILELLSYHDSLEQQAAVAQERAQIRENLESAKVPKQSHASKSYGSPFPHLSTEEDKLEKLSNKTISKTKAKTRLDGDLVSSQNQEPRAAQSETLPPSLPPLPLPKKAKSLDTLRLLFPTATSDLKGTTQWPDFIATMTELGFQAEHRGGSEWTFQSPGHSEDEGGLQGKQSIVIHQPHPDQRMGAVQMQWIGKRLWRRFGWTRERFEGL